MIDSSFDIGTRFGGASLPEAPPAVGLRHTHICSWCSAVQKRDEAAPREGAEVERNSAAVDHEWTTGPIADP